ncbi:protein indeterminate-domain 1-like isoform X1 [Olea europaea var. sylvestris]|uniref:protein indeterminate-domain 1-like isoform X1 n=1 Tax=Olea europaea var. sylvestris TaxID=158386 RepID=UPI000C1D7BE6|nr:protein indeterminate-domain 1-like isoform X1 [Olea europaea var. sylvestris]
METSSISSVENQTTDQPAAKKRRNQPGMPDPDAEVIALSPKALLATNRFVCEICNKGFQREQNLQLHRRGHNLPWKLRQRSGNEVKKRVYVCPEISCIHHHPSRALGDLTGIKKHFCRKHGEKKYKCERCTKIYAVHSDWKAHMKVCGSREYRCDCGTLFSRKDSFITHRAFCDALAQESTRSPTLEVQVVNGGSSSPTPPPLTPSSTGVLSPVLSIQSSAAEFPENQTLHFQPQPGTAALSTSITTATTTTTIAATASGVSTYNGNINSSSGVFASIFASSTLDKLAQPSRCPSSYSDLLCAMAGSECSTIDPISLSLSSSLYLSTSPASLFPTASQDPYRHYASTPQPALSATALLQKAAQIGATSANSSLLRGLGLAMSSSSDPQDNISMPAAATITAPSPPHWNSHMQLGNSSFDPGLGLGIPSNRSSGLNDFMIGPSTSLLSNKPTTLDFLGLGMGASEGPSGEFSAFLTSIGGGLNAAAASIGGGSSSAGEAWDDPSDRKTSLL